MQENDPLAIILQQIPGIVLTQRQRATYAEACAEAGSLLLLPEGFYRRPDKKAPGAMDDVGGRGQFVKIDDSVEPPFVSGQLVTEEASRGVATDPSLSKEQKADRRKLIHLEEAQGVQFPDPLTKGHGAIPEDLRAAVWKTVELGVDAGRWRTHRAQRIAALGKQVSDISVVLKKAAIVEAETAKVSSGFNIALQCVLVRALGWPDAYLPLQMLRGFNIIGDIEDSGIHRPQVDTDAPPDFPTFFGKASSSRQVRQWTASMIAEVRSKGRVRQASEEGLDELCRMTQLCKEEVSNGFASGPHSKKDMDRRWGKGLWWPMKRTFIYQGGGDGGPLKQRAIDNARESGHNAATLTCETIAPTGVEAPALIAAEFLRAAAGQNPPVAPPPLVLSLDDISSAYRRIPVATPQHTAVGIWEEVKPGVWDVRFYVLGGMNFGLRSAVVSFNRAPAFVCGVARALLACPVEHFFDDFVEVGTASCKASVQNTMWSLCKALGLPLADKKRIPPSEEAMELGVLCSLELAHEGKVKFAPSERRCRAILESLRASAEKGRLTPGEASKLYGRLSFILSAAFGRVGRAAALPLVERQRAGARARSGAAPAPAGWGVDSKFHDMLHFFEALLRPGALPAKIVRLDQLLSRHLCVYSDAAQEDAAGWISIGAVLIDPISGARRHISHRLQKGDRELTRLAADRPEQQQLICQLETFAALVALKSFLPWLSGRKVLFFIDNTAALSALVHGTSRSRVMGRMSNMFHLLLAGASVSAWLEFCPSCSNLADIPSRVPGRDWHILVGIGASPMDALLPSDAEWSDPASLMDAGRAVADAAFAEREAAERKQQATRARQ